MKKERMLAVCVVLLFATIVFGAADVYIMASTAAPKKDMESFHAADHGEQANLSSTMDGMEEQTAYESSAGFSVMRTESAATREMEEDQKNDDSGAFVEDDDKIHSYQLVVADVTWSEAFADCIDRGGYLARINSKKEFKAITDFILKKDRRNISFYLGGKRESGSQDYYWVTEDGSYVKGELTNKANAGFWLSGEPSYNGIDENGDETEEDCISMLYYSADEKFVWNDVPNDLLSAAGYLKGKIGYICEFED